MYAIVNIVYGVPYTPAVEDAMVKLGLDINDLGNMGFEFAYSGSSDTLPGWLGVELDEFDEADTPERGYPNGYKSVDQLTLTPSQEQVADFSQKKDNLPPEILRACLEPKVYFIWSTS